MLAGIDGRAESSCYFLEMVSFMTTQLAVGKAAYRREVLSTAVNKYGPSKCFIFPNLRYCCKKGQGIKKASQKVMYSK